MYVQDWFKMKQTSVAESEKDEGGEKNINEENL